MAKNVDKEILEKITDVILDNFKKNEAKINDMNVFPVPDGDTGTNMLLTLKSIKEEMLKTRNPTMKAVLESASMGALMGARGNSGVILSQILRGFFDVIIKTDGFDLDIIREAYEQAKGEVTDDAVLVEALGYIVNVYMGSYENIKVTTVEDLALAEFILEERNAGRHRL